jgi:hypothetical protein
MTNSFFISPLQTGKLDQANYSLFYQFFRAERARYGLLQDVVGSSNFYVESIGRKPYQDG